MNANLVRILALIAAANARIEGMKALNAIRESNGHSLAYNDEDFFHEAGLLECWAMEASESTKEALAAIKEEGL